MGNSKSLDHPEVSFEEETISSSRTKVLEAGEEGTIPVVHHYDDNDVLQRKTYTGQWRDGQRWGKGTLEWANGAVYVGSWENDVLSGFGSFHLPTTNIQYEGEFKNNQFHGTGVLTWLGIDRRYEGSWQESQHHGFGVLYFSPEDTRQCTLYRGEWSQGKRHGFGVMMWENGAMYKGNWVSGKRQGGGQQTFVNGDVSHSATVVSLKALTALPDSCWTVGGSSTSRTWHSILY